MDFNNNINEDKFLPLSSPEGIYPAYITMTSDEYIFIEFIKEIFNNFSEEYNASDPDIATNNNSIIITNSFNKLDEKTGQYPRVVVEALGTQTEQIYISNTAENSITQLVNETKKNNSIKADIPFRISIISNEKNEANILANTIQFSIVENMDVIRKVTGLYQITFPQVVAAQQIRQFQNLFMSQVSFSINKHIYWADIFKIKNKNNFYFRLRAKYSKTDDNPFIMLIYSLANNMSDSFKKYLKILEKALGKNNG